MSLIDVTRPAQGAYCRLSDLIALRFPARQLKLTRHKRALSALAGPNKTNFRGRGIDFEEVRSYQQGDDVRTIDWRVTARTGSAHTKLFREERERPVLVAVDQRSSMFFGSTHCFKSVVAAHLASLIAWSALHSGDRIGGLLFSDEKQHDIRPRKSRKTVLGLLSELEQFNLALPVEPRPDEESFGELLSTLRRITLPGSSVYLVSDFRGASGESMKEQLFELTRHAELTALHVSDSLETTLPESGHYVVTDGHERSELDTSLRSVQQRYREQTSARQRALSRELRALGIPRIEVRTDVAPFAVLQTYYGGGSR